MTDVLVVTPLAEMVSASPSRNSAMGLEIAVTGLMNDLNSAEVRHRLTQLCDELKFAPYIGFIPGIAFVFLGSTILHLNRGFVEL